MMCICRVGAFHERLRRQYRVHLDNGTDGVISVVSRWGNYKRGQDVRCADVSKGCKLQASIRRVRGQYGPSLLTESSLGIPIGTSQPAR